MPLASLLLLLESLAFGRAGGGGHYSGGHSFSGGSSYSGGHSYSGGSSYSGGHYRSGGGDFLFDLLTAYVRWAEAHPLIGIPLTLAIVYVIFRLYTAGNDRYVSVTIGRGIEAQADSRLQSKLAGLRARDPGFSPEEFLARAQAAFLKIQGAWCGLDMAPARAFISDGVMERFSIQLAMQKAEGKHDRMDGLSVREARLLEVESDPQFDTLHVSLRASAVDVEVSLQDGSVAAGDAEAEEFTEVWSFLRRPGAKTLDKPGLIEGQCPNCGSALEIKDAALCSSCKSWVNSGQYDWVLAEITQACEWSVREAGREVPGWGLLSADDPGLNTQFLEDRASVVFWRWQYALRRSDAGLMRSVACDRFCAELAEQIRAKPVRHEDAAVGRVTVLAVEPGGDFDRAHVGVKWSAEGSVLQHVLILGRRKGVQTDERSGLVSARCPACGAPAESREAAACAYCAHAFNDGSRNWVLLEMVPAGLWQRPSWPESGAAPAPAAAADPDWGAALAPADALAVLVSTITADGRVADQEMAYLQSYAKSRAIPPEVADRVIAAANAGTLHVPEPKDPAQVRAVLRGLIRMSLADGSIADAELKLINSFAGSHGLSLEDVRADIAEQRAAMYREAKKALAAR
ncbi:MAG: TIM44-like domain-containing protein [Elusimicrobia bacterium]|nr:TIM44-like domain-containing protein [Elusimicrobiota bacterium]